MIARCCRLTDDEHWMDQNPICNSSVLVRVDDLRIVLDSLPDRQVFQYEDWLIWSLLSLRGDFVFDPEPLVRYRFHSGAATAAIMRNNLVAHYSYIELLLQLALHLPAPERTKHHEKLRQKFRETIMKLGNAYTPEGADAHATALEIGRLLGGGREIAKVAEDLLLERDRLTALVEAYRTSTAYRIGRAITSLRNVFTRHD